MRALLVVAAAGAAARAAVPTGRGRGPRECAGEDAFLLQQHRAQDLRTDDGEDFPDFGLGKLARKVRGAASDAAAKVDEVASTALARIGRELNATLEELGHKTDLFVTEVNTSALSARDGVSARLAEAFNTSVPDLLASAKDRGRVGDLLGDGEALLNVAESSVQGARSLLEAVPKEVLNLTENINESFQGAMTRCKSFALALEDLRVVLEDPLPKLVEDEAIFLEAAGTRATGRGVAVAWADAAEAVLAHAPPPALLQAAGPSSTASAAAEVQLALATARDEFTSFSASLGDAFESTFGAVKAFAYGNLGADASAEVGRIFDDLAARARGVADRADAAYGQLLGSIADGVERAGVPNGAGWRLAPRRGALVAMVAAAAASARLLAE